MFYFFSYIIHAVSLSSLILGIFYMQLNKNGVGMSPLYYTPVFDVKEF